MINSERHLEKKIIRKFLINRRKQLSGDYEKKNMSHVHLRPLLNNINSDYVETCEQKISYKTSFISRAFGKNNWEIFWEEIKSIKPLQTSQGSKVFYFIDGKGKTLLVPQRIENFDLFLDKIENKTNIRTEFISYISPLWTYKLLTLLSFLMIFGEIILFGFKYYQD